MRTVGIVQARMGSQRLPGKVLQLLGGRTVLGWVVRAARDSGALDDLAVATTRQPEDDAVAAECQQLGVRCFRGPTDDVLSRFVGALDWMDWAGRQPADAVVRFSADNPLLDPAVVGAVVGTFAAVPGVDYLSTSLTRTLPLGLDAEVVGAAALRRAHALATGFHRTHVTSYVYCHPEQFRVLGLTFPPDRSGLRVTLDTPEDWKVVEAVVGQFGDRVVPVDEVAGWLLDNPGVRAMNSEVRQRGLADG